MKLLTRFLYFSAVGAVLFASCAKEESESFDKFEDMALEAWMTQNHPDLVKNLQDNGGYYVDVLEASGASDDVKPISDTACWVTFDFTGRDLAGNILSRATPHGPTRSAPSRNTPTTCPISVIATP